MVSDTYQRIANYLQDNPAMKESEFRNKLITEYDLTHNRKAETLFRIAYTLGIQDGLFQVLYLFDAFSELLR